jgi:hypothetical protein
MFRFRDTGFLVPPLAAKEQNLRLTPMRICRAGSKQAQQKYFPAHRRDSQNIISDFYSFQRSVVDAAEAFSQLREYPSV